MVGSFMGCTLKKDLVNVIMDANGVASILRFIESCVAVNRIPNVKDFDREALDTDAKEFIRMSFNHYPKLRMRFPALVNVLEYQ